MATTQTQPKALPTTSRNTATSQPPPKRSHQQSNPQANQKHSKLPSLPKNSTLTKRPLHHPPLSSPYSSSSPSCPKTIYISPSTPFLSAVKRCEKLLRLADKRLVQSVGADLSSSRTGGGGGGKRGGKHNSGGVGKRKAGDIGNDVGGDGGTDGIEALAEAVEERKSKKRRLGGGAAAGEEVLFTGTGRAIGRVAELGGWFLQRGETYAVRVETGSVGGIDDVRVERENKEEEEEEKGGGERMDVDEEEEGGGVTVRREAGEKGKETEEGRGDPDQSNGGGGNGKTEEHAKAKDKDKAKEQEKEKAKEQEKEKAKTPKVVSEEFSRIRQMSVLKVFVSLR